MRQAIPLIALLLACGAASADVLQIPLRNATVVAVAPADGVVFQASHRFRQQAQAFDAHALVLDPIRSSFFEIRLETGKPLPAEWKAFQREQGYEIVYEPREARLTVTAETSLGLAYGLGDLETRLRHVDGKAVLAFPEWREGEDRYRLTERPAIETRGEYINVGYNISGITPHEWSNERWETYIDQLVLARLNRLYFYVWNDTLSMYPGSASSKEPLSRSVHEGLRHAIDYAHKRGIKVTYMACPTLLPKDVWLAHPEIKAEIEYVDAGFPATCSRAPGAWDLMQDVFRSETEWFAKADALQVWFYDPGGCWCEKNGCRQNQAEELARQLRGFADLFREKAPSAAIEYNLWPIWLWEERLGISYRKELDERIKETFGDGAAQVTAVGAPDNEHTKPIREKAMEFKTGIFIFPTNVESGYPFLIPMLRYLSATIPTVASEGYDVCFVHRLEAGTRFANTFFAAQWMWNPGLRSDEVVRRFAGWQTADAKAGEAFAEAITLLDRFSDEGADVKLAQEMTLALERAWACAPSPCRNNLMPYHDTAAALLPVAQSLADDDSNAPQYEEEFASALQNSEVFRPLAPGAREFFSRYRGFLKKGWKNGIF